MAFLTQAANRGSISTEYDIDNSVKLEDDNDEFLTRTNASGTNRKTWTVSVWFKQTELASMRNSYTEIWDGGVFGEGTRMGMDNTDRFWIDIGGGTGNTGTDYRNFSTLKLRDTSAWYHLVVALDTTQSTAANRLKVWLNGTEITAWDQQQIPVQNYQCAVEAGVTMTWGAYNATYHGFSGYLAECHYLDGVAKVQTDFGEYDEDSGIWKPKAYTGTYGTNGCYLDFDNSASLGADSSGNSNTFTLNNIAAADQATDTPTNNFCTWNPLWAFYRNSTITEGGTEVAGAGGGWSHAGATMGVTNGRWYWEWKITSSDIGFISFSTLSGNLNLNQLGHDNSVIMGYGAGNIYTWLNGSQGSTENTGWGTWAVNDIIGIFLDVENSDRRFTLYKNGSAISGNVSFPVSFPNAMQTANGGGNIFPYNVQYENDGGEWNFGGYTTMSNSKSYSDADGHGSFVYTPVLGSVNYYAICTKNLAEYGG